jgi:hypothetical protein
MADDGFVPLSVRHGNRRRRLAWWWSGRRESVALWLAPWLRATVAAVKRTHWEMVCSEPAYRAHLRQVDPRHPDLLRVGPAAVTDARAHLPGGDSVDLEHWKVTLTHELPPLPEGLVPVDLDVAHHLVAELTLPPADAALLAVHAGEQHVTLEIRHDLNPHHRKVRGLGRRWRRLRDIVRFDYARLRGRNPPRELVITIPDTKIESVEAA